MKPLSPRLLITCIALTTFVVMAAVPLGVPGEWTWERHVGFQGAYDFADRIAPAVLVGLLYFAVAVWGHRRMGDWFGCSDVVDTDVAAEGDSGLTTFSGESEPESRTIRLADPVSSAIKLKSVGLYLVLIVAAWGWMRAVQHSAPMVHREVKPFWVLYDSGSSGYFLEAAFGMDSVDEFLAGYEDRMKQGEVLHVGTHPPGLFLLAKACLEACESSPTLVEVLSDIRFEPHEAAFRFVESEAEFGPKLDETQLAALQLLGMLSTLAVVLTIVPLAVLSNWLLGRQTAWMVCCLWATLPCLAVFLPKSDLLFPLTCTAVLAFVVPQRSHWISGACAAVAGLVLFAGLLLSLAHLPVIAFLAAYVTVVGIQTRGASLLSDVAKLILALSAAAVTGLVFSRWTGCDIFGIWRWNLTNHEAFYAQFERTYGKWLIANPLELGLAVGLPVFVAALLAFRSSVAGFFRRRPMRQSAASAFCVAVFATIGALWLSGKNQGEAARLWCFLTPWLVIAVGYWLQRLSIRDESTQWQRLLLAQLLVCLLIVSRVSGFLF